MAKVWFITGVSSGFGQALAKAVIASGNKVAATFRKPEQVEKFNRQYGENGLGILMDVTNESEIKKGMADAMEKFSTIDVLVNNAGFGTMGAIEEFSMEEIREQMETNFFGAMAVTKAIIPIMRQKGAGHIVQISSVAGFRATAGFGVYNASKFALEGFSEALVQEMAAFNIKVTIVEPGPFRTEFLGGSMRLSKQRIEAYATTAVGKTYQYVQQNNGQQEGDPAKGAQAIIDYVDGNHSALRLPLGKLPVQAMRLKMAQVAADLDANEAIAYSTVYEA